MEIHVLNFKLQKKRQRIDAFTRFMMMTVSMTTTRCSDVCDGDEFLKCNGTDIELACIFKELVCNGVNSCGDMEDERTCRK